MCDTLRPTRSATSTNFGRVRSGTPRTSVNSARLETTTRRSAVRMGGKDLEIIASQRDESLTQTTLIARTLRRYHVPDLYSARFTPAFDDEIQNRNEE